MRVSDGVQKVVFTHNLPTNYKVFTKILFKILNKKGIINVGGKNQTIFNFAKKDNKKIKKIYLKRNLKSIMPFDSSMNLSKLKKNIKKK